MLKQQVPDIVSSAGLEAKVVIIPDENIEALKRAKQKGIKIALITARMYSSTKYISCKIKADYGIFSNGSIVMNLENRIPYYEEYIPNVTLNRLIDFAKDIMSLTRSISLASSL